MDSFGFGLKQQTFRKSSQEYFERRRKRPLLENGDKEKVLRELMEQRDPLYREISDLIIETDGRRVQAVAKASHEVL